MTFRLNYFLYALVKTNLVFFLFKRACLIISKFLSSKQYCTVLYLLSTLQLITIYFCGYMLQLCKTTRNKMLLWIFLCFCEIECQNIIAAAVCSCVRQCQLLKETTIGLSLTKLKFNVISNILAGKFHLLVHKYKDGEIKKLCSNQYTSILHPPPLNFFSIANILMQFTARSFSDQGYFFSVMGFF